MRRIGIDVGGTNTDAVLIDGGAVRRAVKAPTTEDVTSGILDALARLRAHPDGEGAVDAVMIGTTHFINAVVQRRQLTRVAAVRIGWPVSASLPPFCDWPADVAALAEGGIWQIEGGHDYDGRPIMALDEAALAVAAREIRAAGLRAVAISSVFAPIDPGHERRAAEILAAELGEDVPITCSHELGRIGLLERENAALLNAALADLARDTIAAFARAIAESGIAAPLFITQNDGTVAEAATARRFPVYSFASGATNSMRGAAYLSGIADAMVADVGGTTTDIGQIKGGFPRESNAVVHIGGVRTLFRMPDLLSIGLGGGSLVAGDPPRVGPVSVGYRLLREARVFGGTQFTATDAAVAAGRLDLGARSRVADIDRYYAERVLAEAARMVEETIDRMKSDAGDVVLIAVGGGAFLIPADLPGVSRVVHVPHGDCANAVGAAIAQISGEVDQIFRDMTRAEAIATATTLASERAVAAGADRETLRIVDTEDMPIAYLPGNALRVRVRMVGDVAAADRPMTPRAETTIATSKIAAYEATDYMVAWNGRPFVMRIGVPSEALSAAYRDSGCASALFVTAFNPLGLARADAENEADHARLGAELRAVTPHVAEGHGADPSGEWPAEKSFLALGVGEADACRIGTAYRQDAVVWAGSDAVPRLLLLR